MHCERQLTAQSCAISCTSITEPPSWGNPPREMSKMKKMAHNFGPVLHRLDDRVSIFFGVHLGWKSLLLRLRPHESHDRTLAQPA